MARRLLIVSVVLILILLLLNFAVSRYASSAMEEELRLVLADQDEAAMQINFESSTVNTLTSSFTFTGITAVDELTGDESRMGSLTLNIPHSDFFRLLTAGEEDNNTVLRRGRVLVDDFHHTSGNRGASYSFDSLLMQVDGDINELSRALNTGFRQPPVSDQFVEADLRGFTSSYDLPDNPMNQRIRFPFPQVDRIVLEGSYIHATDIFTISELKVELPQSELSISGNVDHISSIHDYITRQASGAEIPRINVSLRADQRENRIDIGRDGLGIDFDHAEIRFEGPFFRGITTSDLLLADGTRISADANNFTIFAPETFKQAYGQALGFLGISSDQITLPGITARYSVDNERAEIERLSITNPFADVSVNGSLLYGPGNSWNWQDSELVVEPLTEQSRNFIDTMSSFFDLRLQRDNGQYVIPIRGTLDAPRLEGIHF